MFLLAVSKNVIANGRSEKISDNDFVGPRVTSSIVETRS